MDVLVFFKGGMAARLNFKIAKLAGKAVVSLEKDLPGDGFEMASGFLVSEDIDALPAERLRFGNESLRWGG